MRHDVCVIGLGRVGLPLALSFADAGLSVLGVDNDPDVLAALRERRMPFKEPGTDELLARVDLDLSHRAADGAQARSIVLTLGTPRPTQTTSAPEAFSRAAVSATSSSESSRNGACSTPASRRPG